MPASVVPQEYYVGSVPSSRVAESQISVEDATAKIKALEEPMSECFDEYESCNSLRQAFFNEQQQQKQTTKKLTSFPSFPGADRIIKNFWKTYSEVIGNYKKGIEEILMSMGPADKAGFLSDYKNAGLNVFTKDLLRGLIQNAKVGGHVKQSYAFPFSSIAEIKAQVLEVDADTSLSVEEMKARLKPLDHELKALGSYTCSGSSKREIKSIRNQMREILYASADKDIIKSLNIEVSELLRQEDGTIDEVIACLNKLSDVHKDELKTKSGKQQLIKMAALFDDGLVGTLEDIFIGELSEKHLHEKTLSDDNCYWLFFDAMSIITALHRRPGVNIELTIHKSIYIERLHKLISQLFYEYRFDKIDPEAIFKSVNNMSSPYEEENFLEIKSSIQFAIKIISTMDVEVFDQDDSKLMKLRGAIDDLNYLQKMFDNPMSARKREKAQRAQRQSDLHGAFVELDAQGSPESPSIRVLNVDGIRRS